MTAAMQGSRTRRRQRGDRLADPPRNVLFTITPTACSVDDDTPGGDGLGDHTGGYFCTAGARI